MVIAACRSFRPGKRFFAGRRAAGRQL